MIGENRTNKIWKDIGIESILGTDGLSRDGAKSGRREEKRMR